MKVYIEIADVSSFCASGVMSHRSIEQTAVKMQKRYFKSHSIYPIVRTKNGKPYFAQTDRLFFSGSHTKNFCITVMAENDIAVDIEQCRPKQFLSIAEYAFTETEQQWLTQSTAIERDFFLLWTIKEADIKQHGGSIFSIGNAVRIHPTEGTAVSHAWSKSAAQYTAPTDNAAPIQHTAPVDSALTAYPHTITSFYITAISPQQTVYFVASIIIAGHGTDIEFVWHYATAPHTHIMAEQIFAYPARKA